ncbi:hypothetical protein COT48_01315 [Candidatus Woesearchaeota archaeon CG08_land_8_20_14_0_20_47_9]|nr:MAG: hypothetical protein AUJ69_04425 [Candidatus Woesearchaeota archaeon CG1_02_47_18]PIN72758.1 MAG: hypothetical protein COV22_02370 [Candidatus Woesearchaeota archaeon CG10_big_fil_rev_8_21_14_0_10_47_5]PIO04271.1 MAG: hypothetical protein COT48_01315 [Candidatus Woesearchaeota archaeon CG08_land_8_20_14_0_20_47_9]HII30273.1 hypothetical protein [Candidatus Woesearchaeota archaeon]
MLLSVKRAFNRVRGDIDAIKQNLNGWVTYLNHNQKRNEFRIKMLERRLNELEKRLSIEVY